MFNNDYLKIIKNAVIYSAIILVINLSIFLYIFLNSKDYVFDYYRFDYLALTAFPEEPRAA